MTSLLTKIKSLDTKISTNTQNISNKQNTLTAGENIIISNNTISTTGSITQSQLNLKQDILQAGENITISNNIISSTGGITQSQLTTELNKKQNNLNIYDNIILNSLYVAPFSTKTTTSPAINGEIRSKILSIEDDSGLINVGDSINSITLSLNNKQNILTAGNNITISNNTISATSGAELTSTSNITTGTIDSDNITGRAGTSITAPNLLYGTTNVGTKIAELETNKQNILIAGENITITNNTISSTGGGSVTQAQLDEKQEKLSRNSHVNISSLIVSNDAFSIDTVVSGQISCNSLLIDGVNVETSLNEKQNTLDPTSILSVNRVSTLGDITAGGNLLFMDNSGTKNVKTEFSATNSAINLKQNTLTAGTNITISGNIISATSNSSSYYPYFYVSNVSDVSYLTTSTEIKWNSVKLNNYTNAYNLSTGKYTVPVAGVYFFGGSIASINTTTLKIYIELRKNNSSICEISSGQDILKVSHILSNQLIVQCIVGDTLHMQLRNNWSGKATSSTGMTIYMIYAT